MRFSFLLLSLAFFLISATLCSARHLININSSNLLELSSLAWDPTSNQFVVGSAMGPVVYGIPDNGVVRCLISEPVSNNSSTSVAGVSVDQIRGQLIVAFSNPPSIASYDLKSYQKVYALPLPELGDALGGVTVDSDSGAVFVSAANRGVVLKVGPQGYTKVISELQILNNQGLGGIAYFGHGYILALEPIAGKIVKLDTVIGTVQEVLPEDSSKPLAPSSHAIARYTDKSVVIAADHSIHLVESDDGTWAHAGVSSFKMKLGEGETVVAIAMRENNNLYVYVLVKSKQGYRIQDNEPFHGPLRWYIWLLLILNGLVGCSYCILEVYDDYTARVNLYG